MYRLSFDVEILRTWDIEMSVFFCTDNLFNPNKRSDKRITSLEINEYDILLIKRI